MKDSHPFGPGILRGAMSEVIHVHRLTALSVPLGETVHGACEMKVTHNLREKRMVDVGTNRKEKRKVKQTKISMTPAKKKG